jgi:mercuric ion transport protein
MHALAMTINKEYRASAAAGMQRGQRLTAASGLLAALAASSCCTLPLVLFSLGASGAWIGNLTRLAPYQPYFIAATIALLGCGYWLVYRTSKLACAEGEACARPLPTQGRTDHRDRTRDRRVGHRLPLTPVCRSLKGPSWPSSR